MARPCAEPSPGALACLSTSTLLATLWASHLRVGALRGWRKFLAIVSAAAIDTLLLAAAAVLCMIPLVLATPAYDCMTPKARAVVVLLSSSRARTEITERAERAGTLKDAGQGVAVDAASETAASMISDDGTILLAGAKPPVVFLLQPTLVDGHVTWHCTGRPAALVPSACK